MDWIKKNYEKFALLMLSVALLGVAVLLVIKTRTFLGTFDELKVNVPHNNTVPPLDLNPFTDAESLLKKPSTWTGHPGLLFVSRKYVVQAGKLVDPLEGGEMLHPPVPNAWFVKYNLDILNSEVLNEDADGDGFTNLEEFNAGTDPLDKNSHPPYTTKLRLKQFIKVPFRLIFKARPDADSFQIDTVDIRQPTQILKIGDQIAGTPFKITKFEEKKFTDANEVEHDVSQLTIQNRETSEQIVLILEKQVDSPDSFALFRYLWGENSEFRVKKDQEFSLKPETDVKYKLIDITEREAVIENVKTGEKINVPHLEQ